MRFSILGVLAAATQIASALTPAQWRSQSIYQVLTDRFAQNSSSTAACSNLNDYCGGSWQGLINKLDYIQGMGFTAIWISPVVKNVEGYTQDGSAYHGYWAQDIYQVNPHFGTSSGLKSLSTALHNRGMYLMVDIVVNHFGSISTISSVDYSSFNPFNSQSYFHSYCPIDYSNQTSTEICWMGDNIVPLVDVNTTQPVVRSTYQAWIKQLVANYSIDGIRLDTVAEVEQSFYKPFVSAAGTYIVGEVFNGNPSYVCPYQNYLPGVLNYPAWYWITQAFQNNSGSMTNLANGINTMRSNCSDTTLLGSFLENHDNPRFVSLTSDNSLIKNAMAFTMLSDGIPITYYGQEQKFSGGSTPNNREVLWPTNYPINSIFYTYIASINKFRSAVINNSNAWVTSKASPVYYDSSTIVMRKGATGSQTVSVFSNKGSNGNSYTLSLTSSQTGFTASQSVIEILTCTAQSTDSNGNLNVAMSGGLPRIFFPQSQLSGSGICSSPTTTTVTAAPTNSCPSSVSITFSEKVTTTPGQTIKVVGNVSQLGNWDTSQAVALSASGYTSSNPVWRGTVRGFTPGSEVQYKYINVASDGSVTWEADPNHSYTVPSCAASGSVSDTWQS